MSHINKSPISALGYNFIKQHLLPASKDEYYLRNIQNAKHNSYRALTAEEINALKQNGNTSTNWNNVLVSNIFDPQLIQYCQFFGLVRIGKLEPSCSTYHNLTLPVGLYHSTIISCDLGDNIVINNVRFLAHYIIGNDAIIINVNEMINTARAKFGNGIIKEEEEEKNRIWLEVCNENTGRSILPFDGMLPGDAYLWSRFREDKALLKKFQQFVEEKFSNKQGYYATVGDRTVIKNCLSIKDTIIGADAYIKGATKLKNLTIHSNNGAKTQIGESCELVNGIVNEGCRIFYGVKAVRFITASHSQLKYGARLINSYLGNNATISCCEVLNSLIFPAHEQHHNNSFLCAALIMGQSNIAAGATIGSNHNSRAADGEIIASRGFWPGLCVSLKHNSIFASYTILAKENYPPELNIPIPFSLVSNNVSKDELVIMPGYWFMHNMYALARNPVKSMDRDKRTERIQSIEYDFLAPDTINEIAYSLTLIEILTAKAYHTKKKNNGIFTNEQLQNIGRELLIDINNNALQNLEVIADDFENTKRKVIIIKSKEAYFLFKELIFYYAVEQIISFAQHQGGFKIDELLSTIQKPYNQSTWMNVGGQLMLAEEIEKLKQNIKNGNIKSWDEVHVFYQQQAQQYPQQKLVHAIHTASIVNKIDIQNINSTIIQNWIHQSIKTKEWMTKNIYKSRAKDYENPFRKMVYTSDEEMNAVVGKIEDNSFIQRQEEALSTFREQALSLLRLL